MANKKILLGLTTITKGEWKNKVKEIDELGLKEIALFPTCLTYQERQELYKLLEKTGLISIPHVHLREQDSDGRELDYLVERFKAQVFNIHSVKGTIDFINKNKKYKNIIYLENTVVIDDNFENILKHCGGICLDLAHWENFGFMEKTKEYGRLPELVNKYKIGCNHISAIKPEKTHKVDGFTGQHFYTYNNHSLAELSELAYVKKYKNYLADIISIELENPLRRQLEAKNYLEKLIQM